MSYDKVKSIKVENGIVKVLSACNNVIPLTYEWWTCSRLTEMLKFQGLQEVEIAILKLYESGDFQQVGTSKYSKALKVLENIFNDEYKPFRFENYSYETRVEREEIRNSVEFKRLLLKCLNTKLPKEKFIIHNPKNNAFVSKVTQKYIKYGNERNEAKKFDFEQDALIYSKMIDGNVLRVV